MNRHEASAAAKQFLHENRGLFKFMQDLADLPNLDQEYSSAEVRLTEIEEKIAGRAKELVKMEKTLLDAQQQVTAAAATIELSETKAKEEIEALFVEARLKAKDIISEAEARKDKVEDEIIKAEEVLQNTHRAADEARTFLAELESRAAKAKAYLEKLTKE